MGLGGGGGGVKKQVFIRHLGPLRLVSRIVCSIVITLSYFASLIYWK
jgi:hypothetical protein